MKITILENEVELREATDGTYSYRINDNITVTGIPTKSDALRSIEKNLKPIIRNILKNKIKIG